MVSLILKKRRVYVKQHQFQFDNTKTWASYVLELLHNDVCWPKRTSSLGGAKYFLTSINDFSQKMGYFFKKNPNVFVIFQQFKVIVENESGHHIKIL